MTIHLFVGGLIAAGFDENCGYLITVSHAGRGVFSTTTWERVARDSSLAYPDNGFVEGIGPLAGKSIPVTEIDYDSDVFELVSPNKTFRLHYQEGTLSVFPASA